MKQKYLRLVSSLIVLFGLALTVSLGVAAPDNAPATSLEPAVYHHIAQVVWVVGDVDRVANYWQRLGIHDIHRDGVVKFPNLIYRGKADKAEAKQVTARIAGLDIQWIQPVKGGKFWTDALHKQ